MAEIARKCERTLQACALTAAIAFLASALIYLVFGHWPVTHLDFWRIYEICLTRPWLSAALLKFNYHSLFFPTFIWLADLRFFHGNQEVVFAVGLALLILTFVLLAIPLLKRDQLSLSGKIATFLVLVVANFWMGRSNIIGSGGFSSIASLSTIGTVLAIIYLPALSAGSAKYWKALAIVISGGLVASFSYSSGLATWPVLLLLGYCLRLRLRALIAIALGGVAAATAFALLPGGSLATADLRASFSPLLPGAIRSLTQLCRLLGGPLLSAETMWRFQATLHHPESSLFSLCWGGGGLILAGAAVVPPVIRRNLAGSSATAYLGLALVTFNLLALLAVVIGRAPLIKLLPFEIAAPRYFFWSTLFWAGLLLIGIGYAESKRWLRCSALAGALALLIYLIPTHYEGGTHFRYASYLARIGATSLINGVRDGEALKILFPDPNQIYRVAPRLRDRRLDMFAAGLQDWIGQSQENIWAGKRLQSGMKGDCHVEANLQCDDGASAARVAGWALIRGDQAPDYLIVLDPSGIVCGVGRTFSTNRLLNRLFYLSTFPRTSFTAYIRHYNPNIRYSIRSVQNNSLSTEKFSIPLPARNLPTL